MTDLEATTQLAELERQMDAAYAERERANAAAYFTHEETPGYLKLVYAAERAERAYDRASDAYYAAVERMGA